jgi:hypothetical protein
VGIIVYAFVITAVLSSYVMTQSGGLLRLVALGVGRVVAGLGGLGVVRLVAFHWLSHSEQLRLT